jgi:hypothetical protein
MAILNHINNLHIPQSTGYSNDKNAQLMKSFFPQTKSISKNVISDITGEYWKSQG